MAEILNRPPLLLLQSLTKSECQTLSFCKAFNQKIIQNEVSEHFKVDDKMRDQDEGFHCTVCSEVVEPLNIKQHPKLEVIVCRNCKILVENRISDLALGTYCLWCGKGRTIVLLSCKSCDKCLCAECLTRNLGEDRFSVVRTFGWQCCFCSTSSFSPWNIERMKAQIGGIFSMSDDKLISQHKRDVSEGENLGARAICGAEHEHILVKEQSAGNSQAPDNRSIKGDSCVEISDEAEGYIVNLHREENEEPVRIPPSISSELKAHQVAGIRFMWENVVKSVGKAKSGDNGLGCILAHAMGLGKTFQIFYLDSFTSLKFIQSFSICVQKYFLNHPTDVMVYQFGADVLVCDEAHIIKNCRANITEALKLVRTQRRIALTGSPLQNNLMEYYCMVNFVREGFLGTSQEFHNRFQNPIEIGQHKDSTKDEVKIMNQRAHILYEQLRMDTSVAKNDLPPKTVFVISVKLSSLQKKLYTSFLVSHGLTSDKASSDQTLRPGCFFTGYHTLSKIWNHPDLLHMVKENRHKQRREDDIEDFFMDEGSSDDNMEYTKLMNAEKQQTKTEFIAKKSDIILNNEEVCWWEHFLDEKTCKEVDYSGKMVLLLDILSMSSEIGDKALVFSQSLTTLDLIEELLSKLPRKERGGKYWKQGKDWYRLDGTTNGLERQKLVERFNEPTNTRVKCTLISARAGSLGINLQSANRVIQFDGSWNPAYDLQAIYRVWRYGQNKPVYAYRLIAHRTMVEKIYKCQVSKEGLAARVIDRQQILRAMSREEILCFFDLSDDENTEKNQEDPKLSKLQTTVDMFRSKNNLGFPTNVADSSDKVLENLLSQHYPRWIAMYHEHESLLQENDADRLTKEEKDMAWQTYHQSLELEEVYRTVINDNQQKADLHVIIPEGKVSQEAESSSRSHQFQWRPTNLATQEGHVNPMNSFPKQIKMAPRNLPIQRRPTNLTTQGGYVVPMNSFPQEINSAARNQQIQWRPSIPTNRAIQDGYIVPMRSFPQEINNAARNQPIQWRPAVPSNRATQEGYIVQMNSFPQEINSATMRSFPQEINNTTRNQPIQWRPEIPPNDAIQEGYSVTQEGYNVQMSRFP